jgi:hypothetical protein
MSTNDNRMEVRRNWDLLMPRMYLQNLFMLENLHSHFLVGSGSVLIPEYRDHPLLGDPIIDDPLRSGPLFEASWTHALHCVSISYCNHVVNPIHSKADNY